VKSKHAKDAFETAVSLDGLTVYLNAANTVEQLSLEQLYAIYRGKVTDWKDVGGAPGRIICYGRENSSGTFQYFKEHVLKNEDFATEVQSLPGTAAIINATVKDPSAIGYGGKGYETKGVKELRISTKEGEKGTLPSLENVISGTYPLSRKLFFYTLGEPTGEVKTFIDWVLGEEGQKVCEQVGYYPIPKK
jgi:phosphate transport system substrate-binding protein